MVFSINRFRPPPPPPPKPVKVAANIARNVAAKAIATPAAATQPAPPPVAKALGLFAKDAFEPAVKNVLNLAGGLFGFHKTAQVHSPQHTASGTNDDSVGTNDDSIGTNDDSIGTNDDSIGTNDDSIGKGHGPVRNQPKPPPGTPTVGPDNSLGATINRFTHDNNVENPSYLKPPPSADPSLMGPPNIPAAQNAINTLPLSDDTRTKLNAAMADHDAAWHMADLANATAGMAPDKAAELFTRWAQDPKGTEARIIDHVVTTPAWQGLTHEQKEQIADVFSVAGEQGMRLFGALAESRPNALFAPDSKGNSLLGDLANIAREPLNPALAGAGITNQKLLNDTMQRIVNPERVDQGNAPTCTVTSMEYELVRDDPAEFARLVGDLSSTAGHAQMRGGGVLDLKTDYLGGDPRDSRGVSDVIFQSSAMEFANGADTFNARRGESTSTDGKSTYHGLFPAQQTNMLQNLFGVSYSTQNLTTPAQAQQALDMLKGYQPQGTNRPVIMEINLGDWNHAVTFQGVSGDRVNFRDPYGVERSMSTADFLKYVCTIHVPTAVKNDALAAGDAELAAVEKRAMVSMSNQIRGGMRTMLV